MRTAVRSRSELLRVNLFALSCCESAEPAMGPYFLYTAPEQSCCDSRKSFSAAIDQPIGQLLVISDWGREPGNLQISGAGKSVQRPLNDWPFGVMSSQRRTFSRTSHQTVDFLVTITSSSECLNLQA